jgi:hypothetical protein
LEGRLAARAFDAACGSIPPIAAPPMTVRPRPDRGLPDLIDGFDAAPGRPAFARPALFAPELLAAAVGFGLAAPALAPLVFAFAVLTALEAPTEAFLATVVAFAAFTPACLATPRSLAAPLLAARAAEAFGLAALPAVATERVERFADPAAVARAAPRLV